MSRRAEEHAEVMAMKRKAEMAVLAQAQDEVSENALPIHGNPTTMNMNNILYTNIQESAYTRERCMELMSVEDVIDEIYNHVDHLEPFLPGTARTASTAFCLLYKLFQLRPTEQQLVAMLDHPDSPYIRAIGFLFLRFCAPPADLLDWYWNYLDDPEPVKVRMGARSPPTPMGKFLRGLLLDLPYLDTRLPRIPISVEKDIRDTLAEHPWAEAGAAPAPRAARATAAAASAASASEGEQAPASPRGRDPNATRYVAACLHGATGLTPSSLHCACSRHRSRSRSPRRHSRSPRRRSRSRSPPRSRRSRSRSPRRDDRRSRSRSPSRRDRRDDRDRDRDRRDDRDRDRDRRRDDRDRDDRRDRDRDERRDRDRDDRRDRRDRDH